MANNLVVLLSKRAMLTALFVTAVSLALMLAFSHRISYAANPGLISFQGKVVNADGTNVVNGAYNFDFVLYDDPTLGTPSDGVHDKWHELTKSITVTNGVFQTNLGSVTALPDFNANPTLYLAIRFNADAAGYMTPRIQMTSVPYALNADKLGGLSSSGFIQNQSAAQQASSNFWISGSGRADASFLSPALDVATAGVLSLGTTTATGITIGSASEAGTITLGQSTASNTVNIANANTATGNTQTINIGAGTPVGTGLTNINVGNAINSGKLTLVAGTGGILVKPANSTTAFQIQNAAGNNFLQVDTSGANLYLGSGGIASTIQIGNTTGAVTQTINLGNNATASSTTNTNIGSSVAGTTAITGPTTITNRTSGSADTLVVSNSTSTGYIAKFQNSSTNIFTLASGGAALFQNSTNSVAAFQIQNAAGNDNLFLANTVNPNLVANSSAEASASGWAINTGTGTAPASTTAQALFGNASLAINTSATANAGAKYNTATLLSNTTTYALSFWAKIASGTFTVQAGRSDADTFAGETTCTLNITTVTTTWQRFTCSFTTGTVTTGGYIFIRQSDSTARTWYVDGVQLESGTATPSAYHEGSLQFNGTVTGPTTFQNAQDTSLAFQIQNAAGSTLLTADTANGQMVFGQSSSLSGKLVFNNSTNANAITLVSGVTGSNISLTLPTALPAGNNYCLQGSTAGVLSWSPCGGSSSTKTVTLSPEFAGAVMTGDGTSNVGTMTSDYCSGTSRLSINTAICTAATDEHNYYSWTANATNDYEIFVRWQVPSDFSSFSSGSFYGWRTSASDAVTVNFYNASSTTCATASLAGTAGQWNSTSVTMTSCTPSAGNVITIDTHLSVGVNNEFARIGEIVLTYNRL